MTIRLCETIDSRGRRLSTDRGTAGIWQDAKDERPPAGGETLRRGAFPPIHAI